MRNKSEEEMQKESYEAYLDRLSMPDSIILSKKLFTYSLRLLKSVFSNTLSTKLLNLPASLFISSTYSKFVLIQFQLSISCCRKAILSAFTTFIFFVLLKIMPTTQKSGTILIILSFIAFIISVLITSSQRSGPSLL